MTCPLFYAQTDLLRPIRGLEVGCVIQLVIPELDMRVHYMINGGIVRLFFQNVFWSKDPNAGIFFVVMGRPERDAIGIEWDVFNFFQALSAGRNTLLAAPTMRYQTNGRPIRWNEGPEYANAPIGSIWTYHNDRWHVLLYRRCLKNKDLAPANFVEVTTTYE